MVRIRQNLVLSPFKYRIDCQLFLYELFLPLFSDDFHNGAV